MSNVTYSPDRYLHPSLGVQPDSVAELSHLQDSDLAQEICRKLNEHFPGRRDAIEDFSANQNGTIIIGGRYIASNNKAFYWMVKDNRLHVIPSFPRLPSEQDKMQCLNQALVAYAGRSNKPDLKSAAIAVTQRGYFYIAHNTKENNDWNKECAEDNVKKIVGQLCKSDDKIERIYVVGGLTDAFNLKHVKDQLIGMCMRCVAGLMADMAEDATVTIVPANDAKATIGLRKTHHMDEVKANEAWQVPFSVLVEPSILRFGKTVKEAECKVFESWQVVEKLPVPARLPGSDTPLTEKELLTPEKINAFIAKSIKSAVSYRQGITIKSVAMAVVEVQRGNEFWYEFSHPEIMGETKYNARVAPVSYAANLPYKIAESSDETNTHTDDAHINRIFFTGYNADGSPYICDPEQWDRGIKRTWLYKSPPITFIPLNDGHYPASDVMVRSMDDEVPTRYRGSLQAKGTLRVKPRVGSWSLNCDSPSDQGMGCRCY